MFSTQEIIERLSELRKHHESLKDPEKITKNQQTIEYYEKLLSKMSSDVKSPLVPSNPSIPQEFDILTKVLPPVPNRRSTHNSFSKTPNDISQEMKEIVYVDHDGDEIVRQTSPHLVYSKNQNMYPELLQKEKWGAAYRALSDFTSALTSKIFVSNDSERHPVKETKYLDLTKPQHGKDKQSVVQDDKEDDGDFIDVKADQLIEELNTKTDGEDDYTDSTDREIEALENSVGQNLSAEQELVEMEQDFLQEKLNQEVSPSIQFQIQDSVWVEEFDLLRQSFIEAVSTVKKWKTDTFVDKDDKVLKQDKATYGIEIHLSSGKKVIYSPVTQESKIYCPNGTIIHKYKNGDHKMILLKDQIVTYTANTGLYHVVNASSSRNYSYAFYYIRSGACVKMYKDGIKIQVLPKGDRILIKEEVKEILFANGMKERIHLNGIREIYLKNGKKILKK